MIRGGPPYPPTVKSPVQLVRQPREVVYKTDKPLPYDEAAERAVLAAILLDNASLVAVRPLVNPEDFHVPALATIYQCFCDMGARGDVIDIVTASNELRSIERLNTVGGPQFLGSLTDEIPTVAHVESHARIVADFAAARRFITASMETVTDGFNGGPVDAFIDRAMVRLAEAAKRPDQGQTVLLEDSIIESFARIETALLGGQRILGVPTGFRDYDALTAGMHGGQLIVIAARPAMGKTSLVLNIATHAASVTGRPVLFFSLEMPRIELTNRLLCSEAGVDLLRLRTGTLSQDDVNGLTRAANALHKLPILINDLADQTPAEMRAIALRVAARHRKPPACIIIDYLQLMRFTRARYGGPESREREVAEISKALKGIAKELDVPVIALAQLNRDCEKRPGKNRRPMLADLRESGSIEQDADVVSFIYRDEVYNRDSPDKGIAEIILAKQRNGPTDTVRLRFLKSFTRFENLASAPAYDMGGANDLDGDFGSGS